MKGWAGVVFYRCRLCGVVERGRFTENARSEFTHALVADRGGNDPERRRHDCADGRIGIADFAGIALEGE